MNLIDTDNLEWYKCEGDVVSEDGETTRKIKYILLPFKDIKDIPTVDITPCFLGSPCEYQNEDVKIISPWICASEELPEEEGLYICVIAKSGTDEIETVDVVPRYLDMNERMIWAIETIKDEPYKVVAWMPIPDYDACELCPNHTKIYTADGTEIGETCGMQACTFKGKGGLAWRSQ